MLRKLSHLSTSKKPSKPSLEFGPAQTKKSPDSILDFMVSIWNPNSCRGTETLKTQPLSEI